MLGAIEELRAKPIWSAAQRAELAALSERLRAATVAGETEQLCELLPQASGEVNALILAAQAAAQRRAAASQYVPAPNVGTGGMDLGQPDYSYQQTFTPIQRSTFGDIFRKLRRMLKQFLATLGELKAQLTQWAARSVEAEQCLTPEPSELPMSLAPETSSAQCHLNEEERPVAESHPPTSEAAEQPVLSLKPTPSFEPIATEQDYSLLTANQCRRALETMPTPVPTAPLGPNCKVEVAGFPVAIPGLPDIAFHVFIIYTDESGRQVIYRGGRGTDGKVLAERQFASQPGNDLFTLASRHGEASRYPLLEGPEACRVDTCFDSEIARINAANAQYCAAGPSNSNSVASTLLERCDVPVPNPTCWTHGWRTMDYTTDTDEQCIGGVITVSTIQAYTFPFLPPIIISAPVISMLTTRSIQSMLSCSPEDLRFSD